MPPLHFIVFIVVSIAVFVGILRWTFRARATARSTIPVAAVAFVVVVVGMCFAKFGANSGLPVYVYYGVPAAVTLLLPPLAFRMSARELLLYIVLAFLSSPAIHFVFSFFIGWHEYLPFWNIPSVWQLAQES